MRERRASVPFCGLHRTSGTSGLIIAVAVVFLALGALLSFKGYSRDCVGANVIAGIDVEPTSNPLRSFVEIRARADWAVVSSAIYAHQVDQLRETRQSQTSERCLSVTQRNDLANMLRVVEFFQHQVRDICPRGFW